MGEIKRLDAGQAQGAAVLGEAADRVGARQQGAATAFVNRPGARRGHVGLRVGVGQAF